MELVYKIPTADSFRLAQLKVPHRSHSTVASEGFNRYFGDRFAPEARGGRPLVPKACFK